MCTAALLYSAATEGEGGDRREEVKEEKDQMAQIDWHDFVVVETIAFTAEDDNLPLAPPIDVSTGAQQGAPVPLDAAVAFTADARIEKPKVIEEEPEEEAKAELEREKEKERKKEEKEREKEELREKEGREKEEKEKEEKERMEKMEREAELAMPEEEP